MTSKSEMILNDLFLLNQMKKIEAVIQAVREQDVVNALTKLKIGGFTVLHGKGCGKSTKLEYGDPFTNILTVFTVVLPGAVLTLFPLLVVFFFFAVI